MCGIAGVLSFQGAHLADGVADAMAATLTQRGPDAEGRWSDEHVLLLFRRLAVIDLAGGGQPMVARADGQTVAVLDYTGEVFNFVELREQLRSLGHSFDTSSDTEVVLRAYEQWGPDCAQRLVGMFAFAVWDPRRQQLVLIRDRFGIYPLHYTTTSDGVIFGSEPKSVLAHPSVNPEVDLAGMREMLSFAPTPGRSPFRGVSEVPPGTVMVFSRDGARTHRFWQLGAHEHPDDLGTTIATIREMLERSVAEQIVADVPLCVMLSGGLDSSAIAALAAQAIKARDGGLLRTFSVDFAGHAERFRAGEMYGTPDKPFVAEVVRHIGSDHTEVVLDSTVLLDDFVRGSVARALDMPAPGGEMYTSLYLLSRAVRQESTVTLTGDASDELFGGYLWFHDDWYRNCDTFPWLAASHRMEMLTGLLDRELVKRLDMETYQRDHYNAALAEVPRLAGEDGLDRRIREITYLNLTRYLRVVLDRKDRMGMACALEGRVPFCDHRLVDYVFNIPWAMKSFDGREKSLLRAAVRDLLPQPVLDRVKAPFPTTQDPAYRTGLRERLHLLLDDPHAPARALLDTDRMAAALRGPDYGARLGITRLSVDWTVQLNQWMVQHAIGFTV